MAGWPICRKDEPDLEGTPETRKTAGRPWSREEPIPTYKTCCSLDEIIAYGRKETLDREKL